MRFSFILSAAICLATSAPAQTIPTFGGSGGDTAQPTIPSFGGGTATGQQQPAIPSFGGTQQPAVPTFGAEQPPAALPAPAAAAPATPPPPQAAPVLASDPVRILDLVQQAGYRATLGTDNVGDPKISSQISESEFSIYFYGCENGQNCTTVQLVAGYNLADGISAEAMNEWNASKRFAYAYVDDENDPFLNMDLNLDYDGQGEKNFIDTLELWGTLVEDFEDHIGW